MKQADDVTAQTQTVLAGLMPKLWVDRYLAERLQPLREEQAMLDARAAKITPFT